MDGMHHLHIRKREPYPAKTMGKRLLDDAVFAAGVIGPLSTIPQVLKIYLLQNATGVSAFSWGVWAILDLPWVLYGIVHKERPITITYIMWFIANAAVFVGAIIYGNGTL